MYGTHKTETQLMRNLKIDIICTTFTKKKGEDTIIKCEQKHLGNLISKI